MALFAFLATGIADSAEGRRPGARHAMLIYVAAEDFEAAKTRAGGVAIGAGWTMVRLEKGKPIDSGATEGADLVLQAAAATALEEGSAIVVYADELPADA